MKQSRRESKPLPLKIEGRGSGDAVGIFLDKHFVKMQVAFFTKMRDVFCAIFNEKNQHICCVKSLTVV